MVLIYAHARGRLLLMLWCHTNEAPIEGMSQRRLTRACAVCVGGAAGDSTRRRSLMLGLSRATGVSLARIVDSERADRLAQGSG